MKVCDLVNALNLKVFSCNNKLNTEITGGYASDLLSDVMGNANEGMVWITLQTHKNIIAVASLKELAAIILVKGYEPDASTIQQSIEEEIPILGTDLQTFELSGKIYCLLSNNRD
jgi:predicted transcriptional regulator